MIESDIFKIEAAEHHGQPPHGASAHEAHPAGIAPHAPDSAHGTDEDIHHETRTESTERNGGNNEE